MSITLINIGLYFFQALMFLYYCNSIFNSKFKKGFRLLFILLGFSILFFINLLAKVYLNGIMVVLTIFLIVFFVYNESVWSSLLQAILYLAVLAASEYVALPIVNIVYKLYDTDFHNDFHGYLFATIISKTIHFICIIILIWFFNRKNSKSISRKGMLLTLTVPLSNIAILIMVEYISRKTAYSREMNIVWGVIAGILLLLTFLLLFNRSYLINQADRIYELNLERKKQELDRQYFNVIEKSNNDMRILAHDYKNHLTNIRNLQSLDEINSYIDRIFPEVEKFNKIGISKNKTLDLILSKYTSICEIKKIDFKIDVKEGNLKQIDGFDLTIVLNNLLDNAVEAAEKSEKKQISFKIISENDYYDKLLIVNSCDLMPKSNSEGLLTAKKKEGFHGYGLKSVKRIVRKYQADYYWEYVEDSNEFITSILFPKCL